MEQYIDAPMPGESPEQFSYFLIYRNLGPNRSLDKAYQKYKAPDSNEKLQAGGNWADLSSKYSWVARSSAWDIAGLKSAGQLVITNFYEALGLIITKAVEYLKADNIRPGSFLETVEVVQKIGEYIDPAAIEAWRESAANNGIVPPDSAPSSDN